MILPMAERLIAWTAGSKAMLEVQFEGESGFGDGATQSFYSEVALALMKRTVNADIAMWMDTTTDTALGGSAAAGQHLHSARGLYPQPYAKDDRALPKVCARFRFLGQLMA